MDVRTVVDQTGGVEPISVVDMGCDVLHITQRFDDGSVGVVVITREQARKAAE